VRKVSITGGKGGTGKSTVAVNLAILLSRDRDVVLGDLDVEAPNDHILLGVELENESPVHVMMPFIDYERCTKCGACGRVCDTGAIMAPIGKPPFVFPRLCSGCRACFFACPKKAILEGRRILGSTYSTPVPHGGGFRLVTGMLREGEEHSSPVVLAARKRADEEARDLLLVDTAAGTGNNVSIAITGSDLILAVTEPTPLGAHDLSMILELTGEMGLETWVVLNKAGIGSEDLIRSVAEEHGSRIVERIPYSREVVNSYISSRPIALGDSPASAPYRRIAELLGGVV